MDERRPSRWRAALPLLAVLCAWNAYQLARFHQPLKAGHEAWIGRQIGRTARNHLVLGLGVTKGANVTTIRDGGGLELHRSYSPLASWVVALPMAAGLPFHDAVRLPVLLSMNLFLASLWAFARGRWGGRVAAVALAYAALCPVIFLRYGLACIFEILALGPLMAVVALYAGPSRTSWARLGMVASSIAAVMFSWICWLVVVPCAIREARRGRVLWACLAGGAAIVVPVALHFGATARASGDPRADVLSFVHHVGFRASAGDARVMPVVTFRMLFEAQAVRWSRNLGALSLAAMGVAAVAAWRRKPQGWRWLVLLLAFALPMNLARNLAYYHDFFIILFVPAVALVVGLVVAGLAARICNPAGRGALMAGLLVGFLLIDVLPMRKPMKLRAADVRQQSIADGLGAIVRPDDFVVVNGEVCGIDPKETGTLGVDRQRSPRPYYAGEMAQTVHVATDADDAARVADLAPEGRRVVVVEIDGSWSLPREFERREAGVPALKVSVQRPGPDRIATRPGRD